MGRAATVNGNGRAVLPPPVVEPMRRYQAPPPPPRSKRGTAAKVFGWILIALLVVASGLAGGLYLYYHETTQRDRPAHGGRQGDREAPCTAAHRVAARHRIDHPATDARAGSEGFSLADSRSDTIMLVRADPTTNTLSLLSFPRDLQVPIYCDAITALRTDRINSACRVAARAHRTERSRPFRS